MEQHSFTFDPAAFSDELNAAASNFAVGSRLLYDQVHLHEITGGEAVVHDLENEGESLLSFTTVELL